jgi:hypothetical protein
MMGKVFRLVLAIWLCWAGKGASLALAAEFEPMLPFKEYAPVRLKGFDPMPAYPAEKFSKIEDVPKPPEVKLAVPDQKYNTFKDLREPKVNLPPYAEQRYRNYASYRPIAQGPFKSLPEPRFHGYAKFAPFSK